MLSRLLYTPTSYLARLRSLTQNYSIASMSAEFDDQLVHALSCLSHIRQHVLTVPTLSHDQKKYLSLLDGIALLLVTEGKGDVAAVSFLHTNMSIEFYYAKNRPCTPGEMVYIQKLLEMAQTFQALKSIQWVSVTLELVVQMCMKKVKGRMRKITSELKKCEVGLSSSVEDIRKLSIWLKTDCKGEFPKAYRNAFPLGKSAKG
jgi:hypothetical protein